MMQANEDHPVPTFALSIVIPTTSDVEIQRLLGDLAEQLPMVCRERAIAIEVVVVWNGPDEARAARVQAALERFPHAQFRRSSPMGIARARNEGVTRARGEYIAWLDSDCRVGPGYLAAVVDVLGKHTAVRGRVRFRGDGTHVSTLEAALRHQVYHHIMRDICLTPNLIIHRSCYAEHGGFTSEYGDDAVWSWRSRVECEDILDAVTIESRVPRTGPSIVRRWLRYGMSGGWWDYQRLKRGEGGFPYQLRRFAPLLRAPGPLGFRAFVLAFYGFYTLGMVLALPLRSTYEVDGSLD